MLGNMLIFLEGYLKKHKKIEKWEKNLSKYGDKNKLGIWEEDEWFFWESGSCGDRIWRKLGQWARSWVDSWGAERGDKEVSFNSESWKVRKNIERAIKRWRKEDVN